MKRLMYAVLITMMCFAVVPSVTAVIEKYDVTDDGVVDYEDALAVWAHHSLEFDAMYDINGDGVIDYEDALEVWVNRPPAEPETVVDWLSDVIWS